MNRCCWSSPPEPSSAPMKAPAASSAYPYGDLLGRHLAEMTEPPWDKTQTLLRRVSGSRQSIVGALDLRRSDGTVIHWRCCGNLVQPAANGTPPVLCLRSREPAEARSPFLHLNRQLENLKQEVTRRQLAEARLQQVNARLEALVAQEIAAREQAQHRVAQLQRMEALGPARSRNSPRFQQRSAGRHGRPRARSGPRGRHRPGPPIRRHGAGSGRPRRHHHRTLAGLRAPGRPPRRAARSRPDPGRASGNIGPDPRPRYHHPYRGRSGNALPPG